jgi:hypothetical protein
MLLVGRDLSWFVNFAFYRQWELTNKARTSHIVQNLSCDMSFEHKNSDSGRSVYEICACCRDAECNGAKGVRHHSSTADKGIFWEKWHPKLKNQNHRAGELCAQSTEKEKNSMYFCQICDVGHCLKDALNCISRRSITEVMTIILLHLYRFKVSVLNFQKNWTLRLRIKFF